jgi:hypothetical protein
MIATWRRRTSRDGRLEKDLERRTVGSDAKDFRERGKGRSRQKKHTSEQGQLVGGGSQDAGSSQDPKRTLSTNRRKRSVKKVVTKSVSKAVTKDGIWAYMCGSHIWAYIIHVCTTHLVSSSSHACILLLRNNITVIHLGVYVLISGRICTHTYTPHTYVILIHMCNSHTYNAY